MKVMKLALLGTAALAVVSVSARADNLADLKAQIETLNSRVASLETAPAVPAGYQMLTMSKGAALVMPGAATTQNEKMFGNTAHVISVMPTADMPAATELSWSGFVRAAIVYNDDSRNGSLSDVDARAGLAVAGKTDTAVGEVGAKVTFIADSAWSSAGGYHSGSQSTWTTDGVWGYWKMTPELTLGGGYGGSLSGNGYGWDGACTCIYTDNNVGDGYNIGDVTQMRLTYASGPLSVAVALEDGSGANSYGVAGEIKYAGDLLSGEISAGYRPTGRSHPQYVIDAGVGFGLGEFGNLSVAAGYGDIGYASNAHVYKASALLNFKLGDQSHVELGVNHVWSNPNPSFAGDITGFSAGIYYDPVKQLTIGLEGEYAARDNTSDKITADLVTVFRF